MMNNCTVRFYTGLLFHVTGAVAFADFGLRTDRPMALSGAAGLAATAVGMSYAPRNAGLPSRGHAAQLGRRATASSP